MRPHSPQGSRLPAEAPAWHHFLTCLGLETKVTVIRFRRETAQPPDASPLLYPASPQHSDIYIQSVCCLVILCSRQRLGWNGLSNQLARVYDSNFVHGGQACLCGWSVTHVATDCGA